MIKARALCVLSSACIQFPPIDYRSFDNVVRFGPAHRPMPIEPTSRAATHDDTNAVAHWVKSRINGWWPQKMVHGNRKARTMCMQSLMKVQGTTIMHRMRQRGHRSPSCVVRLHRSTNVNSASCVASEGCVPLRFLRRSFLLMHCRSPTALSAAASCSN
jgi:hypothetical protein